VKSPNVFFSGPACPKIDGRKGPLGGKKLETDKERKGGREKKEREGAKATCSNDSRREGSSIWSRLCKRPTIQPPSGFAGERHSRNRCDQLQLAKTMDAEVNV